MDPATRRFELLQLEFDSMKAIVSDVLAQIPLSVTEKSLRFQVYTGIVGQSGKELTSSQLLSGFCKGNDILVAIPQGYSASDSARLAHPILGDSRVDRMVSFNVALEWWFTAGPCIQLIDHGILRSLIQWSFLLLARGKWN
jgi:hypothetical protein